VGRGSSITAFLQSSSRAATRDESAKDDRPNAAALETVAFLLAQDAGPSSQLIANLLSLAQPPAENFTGNEPQLLDALVLDEPV
jgi:hypothetical protein